MLHYGLTSSSYAYHANDSLDDLAINSKTIQVDVLKNETFAAQLLMWSDLDSHYSLDFDHISWRGLVKGSYRVEISPWIGEDMRETAIRPTMRFIDYVKDDHGILVSDPIITKRGIEREAKTCQGVWIDETFPEHMEAGSYQARINIFAQEAYEDEVLLASLTIEANVHDAVMISPKDSDFFLDLWQHPSNWARHYQVKMWSDEHFYIIETHLAAMARIGQKVVTLICSDYPWAGQKCYAVNENHSNLFEHNIVQITRNKEGCFSYDFSHLERYLQVAKKVGIEQEIDIFGLLGNWDRVDFGNPLSDYKDPIRLKYYDQKEGNYRFMKEISHVQDYIAALFKELDQLGVWDKVRIMCDEPDHPESFKANTDFLKALAPKKLKVKSAIHVADILPLSTELMDNISLGFNVLGACKGDVSDMQSKLKDKGGNLTWYVCCFPERPNNFLSSPRIENRLIAWFTHYYKLDGFLRWDFAIWPDNPYTDASYKYPKWTAGDMFFVYPGKNMKVVTSQRLENLFFGIQDKLLMQDYEEKTGLNLEHALSNLLGKKEALKVKGLNVDLDYSLDNEDYMTLRKRMINELNEKSS